MSGSSACSSLEVINDVFSDLKIFFKILLIIYVLKNIFLKIMLNRNWEIEDKYDV